MKMTLGVVAGTIFLFSQQVEDDINNNGGNGVVAKLLPDEMQGLLHVFFYREGGYIEAAGNFLVLEAFYPAEVVHQLLLRRQFFYRTVQQLLQLPVGKLLICRLQRGLLPAQFREYNGFPRQALQAVDGVVERQAVHPGVKVPHLRQGGALQPYLYKYVLQPVFRGLAAFGHAENIKVYLVAVGVKKTAESAFISGRYLLQQLPFNMWYLFRQIFG